MEFSQLQSRNGTHIFKKLLGGRNILFLWQEDVGQMKFEWPTHQTLDIRALSFYTINGAFFSFCDLLTILTY